MPFTGRKRSSLPVKGRSNRSQRVRHQYDDPAPFQQNPFLLLPKTQLLVRALPRYPDHFAEMTLGQCNSSTAGRRSGVARQLKKGLGKSARQIQKHDILKLLGGLPKASAQYLNKLDRKFRPFVNER